MFTLIRAALLFLVVHTSFMKTSTEGPEAITLGSITSLLSPEECHELYLRLAIPQKNTEQPSEEKDGFPHSQWKDVTNMAQCKESLRHWLETQKDAVDWDRLARALRQIGRPDVSRELKKSLNKNRSFEPKWTIERNETVLTIPKSAIFIEDKAVSQQNCHRAIQEHRKTSPKESWGLEGVFLKLFPYHLRNLTLQQCFGPAARLLLACFLTGIVLWLVSAYYAICWNLGQCLFAYRVRYNATPAGQNMNLTVIWNHQSRGGREDESSTSGDEDGTEDEP